MASLDGASLPKRFISEAKRFSITGTVSDHMSASAAFRMASNSAVERVVGIKVDARLIAASLPKFCSNDQISYLC